MRPAEQARRARSFDRLKRRLVNLLPVTRGARRNDGNRGAFAITASSAVDRREGSR